MSTFSHSRSRGGRGAGEAFLLFIGGIVSVIAIIAVAMIGSGIVGMKVWNWFVPLAFHSAPHLSVGKAIGLSIVIGTFFPKSASKRKESDDATTAFVNAIFAMFGVWGMTLLLGWIVHSLIT